MQTSEFFNIVPAQYPEGEGGKELGALTGYSIRVSKKYRIGPGLIFFKWVVVNEGLRTQAKPSQLAGVVYGEHEGIFDNKIDSIFLRNE
jgi:hypothetical protein